MGEKTVWVTTLVEKGEVTVCVVSDTREEAFTAAREVCQDECMEAWDDNNILSEGEGSWCQWTHGDSTGSVQVTRTMQRQMSQV